MAFLEHGFLFAPLSSLTPSQHLESFGLYQLQLPSPIYPYMIHSVEPLRPRLADLYQSYPALVFAWLLTSPRLGARPFYYYYYYI